MAEDRLAGLKQRLRALSPEQRKKLASMLRAKREGDQQRLRQLAQNYNEAPAQKFLRRIFGREPKEIGSVGTTADTSQSIPGMPENPENPIADKIAGLMGTGIALAGPAEAVMAGGAAAGLSGAARALLGIGKRAAIGAGVGAGVGSLPVIGMGAKEGAELGMMIGAGQGGTGALWRHGRRKGLIEWLLKKAAGESEATLDDALKGLIKKGVVASDDAATLAAMTPEEAAAIMEAQGMSTTMGRGGNVIPMRPSTPAPPSGTASTLGQQTASVGEAPAEQVVAKLGGQVKAASEAAREFGLKAGSKVHNITVGGKVLQWFPTPDKAKGAILRLAKQYNWKRVGVGKYETPEGAIAQLDWTIAMG